MTLNQMLFGVFPYVAIAVAIGGSIWRYVRNEFSYSSLSSQFLENKQLFWGSVLWHYGVLFVLAGHLVGFLIPRSVLAWNGVPWRLYVLEGSALAFGFMTLFGIILLIARRVTNSRVRVVTSRMDVVLLIVLLIQVAAGVWTAIFHRWGSSWYAGFAVPYLVSILKFSPDISLVSNLPFMVQTHIIDGFVLIFLMPFTRLVHFLVAPLGYVGRPHQVVVWNHRADVA
jgi:nitrate reductase gamma subunit